MNIWCATLFVEKFRRAKIKPLHLICTARFWTPESGWREAPEIKVLALDATGARIVTAYSGGMRILAAQGHFLPRPTGPIMVCDHVHSLPAPRRARDLAIMERIALEEDLNALDKYDGAALAQGEAMLLATGEIPGDWDTLDYPHTVEDNWDA